MAAILDGAAPPTAQLVVDTTGGRLRGTAGAGCIAFRGIRYAVADRFSPPRPPEPHVGIVDSAAYGAVAPQTNPAPAGPPPVILAHLPRPANAPPPSPPVESEDCLFLNVWTSTTDRNAKLPVMVWLHGGFFAGGSGATGDGAVLAARGDVVAVSLNHRLNAFGYSHLADVAGADFAQSGSLGMLDIVAALRWVRENIAAFGGDPARVTVFGSSGGGMKIAWLLASPAAHGLFDRAIVQSGPALRLMDRDRASEAVLAWLAELGLKPAQAHDLRTLPMAALLAAYHRTMAKRPPASFTDLTGFAPVIDAVLLPHHPFDPAAPMATRQVPLLIGSNADEMSFFMGNDAAGFALDAAGVAVRAQALLGARAAAAVAHYTAKYPQSSPAQVWLRLSTDRQIRLPTVIEADRKAALGGAPVHSYWFDWPSPALDGKLGATHTLESSLVFGQIDGPLVMNAPGAAALARRMGDAWVGFAATGNPGWPAYGSERWTMRIGENWAMERDPFGAELPLLA